VGVITTPKTSISHMYLKNVCERASVCAGMPCVGVYVCMCVCVYVSMCVCVPAWCVRLRVCVLVCMYTCVYLRVHM